MAADTRDFSPLLDEFKRGDVPTSNKRIALVYADLHRLPRAQMGPGLRDRTFGPTSLVHEWYRRITDPTASSVESKNHFFNLASKVMRQVLCNYARERIADKRGGQIHDTLSAVDNERKAEATALIEQDELPTRLERQHRNYVPVFECRYFAGSSEQGIADTWNLSLRTAKCEWNLTRQWSEHLETP